MLLLSGSIHPAGAPQFWDAPAVSVICSVLFDTTSRTVGRLNEPASGSAHRESHPSEDLSELPPLRVAVAGQEYQRWCCHRKTGRPRSAFWTNGPANHLPCRIDADCSAQVGHRAFSNVACQFSVFTWHTSGCISASGYVLEKVQDGLALIAPKSPSLLIRVQPYSHKKSSKASYKVHKISKFRQYFSKPVTDSLLT